MTVNRKHKRTRQLLYTYVISTNFRQTPCLIYIDATVDQRDPVAESDAITARSRNDVIIRGPFLRRWSYAEKFTHYKWGLFAVSFCVQGPDPHTGSRDNSGNTQNAGQTDCLPLDCRSCGLHHWKQRTHVRFEWIRATFITLGDKRVPLLQTVM
jgi:hypothetical protein